MANTTVTTAALLKPEELSEAFLLPLAKESIAAQVSTVLHPGAGQVRLPVVSPSTASWTAEAAEINVSDLPVTEVNVEHHKLAQLVPLSNELLDDSAYPIEQVLSDALVSAVANKIDAAYFSSLATAPAGVPSGLGTVAGVTALTPTAFGIDSFVEAVIAIEAAGGRPQAIVMGADLASELYRIKSSNGSNEYVLNHDSTSDYRRTILGIPVVVSDHVAANTAWILDPSASVLSIRKDVSVEMDSSALFSKDMTAFRVIARVGTGFSRPARIGKIEFNV